MSRTVVAMLIIVTVGDGSLATEASGHGVALGTLAPQNEVLIHYPETPCPVAITGGSGAYAGASGGGTVEPHSNGPPNFGGIDVWSGTLIVPGHAFDLTAPTITEEPNRARRAPRKTRARHLRRHRPRRVDPIVPATCSPRSGFRFHLGSTRVHCSATDTSGNTRKATFTVTIRRRGTQ